MMNLLVGVLIDNISYSTTVSTEGCSNLDEIRSAIKKKLTPHLDRYAISRLALFTSDQQGEISSERAVLSWQNFKNSPSNRLIVKIDEYPSDPRRRRSRKQLIYKKAAGCASCRKLLDSIAASMWDKFTFEKTYNSPTIGDVLYAKDGPEGEKWGYRSKNGQQMSYTSLPAMFSPEDWLCLKKLNSLTSERIHDARLPRTSIKRPFVILPHEKFATAGYIQRIMRIVTQAKILKKGETLIVKDDSILSESSDSEYCEQ